MLSNDEARKPDVISPEVTPFFDEPTNTFSYVVQDPTSTACALIDAVLDYDSASGRTGFRKADEIIRFVEQKQLNVEWIIETHVHADHLTSAPYLQQKLGGRIGIGKDVVTVQETFAKIFNCKEEFVTDGSQFDHLFADGEYYKIGNMSAYTLHTPGHTPACMTHVIGDAAFVGDTLFMPDAGTARADFPGGDATQLFKSIHRILSLPAQTRLFMCHDYGTEQRHETAYQSMVQDQLDANIHVGSGVDEADFVTMRDKRDRTLDMPHLILPSLQVNMRAGHFPAAEDNGVVYLKIPVDAI